MYSDNPYCQLLCSHISPARRHLTLMRRTLVILSQFPHKVEALRRYYILKHMHIRGKKCSPNPRDKYRNLISPVLTENDNQRLRQRTESPAPSHFCRAHGRVRQGAKFSSDRKQSQGRLQKCDVGQNKGKRENKHTQWQKQPFFGEEVGRRAMLPASSWLRDVRLQRSGSMPR